MSIVLDGTSGLTSPAAVLTTTPLAVTSGGTGVTTSTGTGAGVHATAPTITGATITVAATAAPAFSAYNSVYQTISNQTFTKLNCDTENFDTNSNLASSRFTPTVAGYYQFTAAIQTTAAAQKVNGYFYKNGTRAWESILPNSSIGPTVCFTGLLYANGSTDYFELYFYQNSGGNMTAGIADPAVGFSAAMVRSA